MLTSDTWLIVGTMLKPRHLSKLMRTNKTLLGLLDNEEYWTRVATHLVWRGDKRLELNSRKFTEMADLLPAEEHNLYYMIGLDRGYKWGMDRFIQRVQMAIEANSSILPDGHWWKELKLAPTLRSKTVKFYESTGESWLGTFLPTVKGDEQDISMKELARRVTEQDWINGRSDPMQKLIKDFVCRMEDADMSPASKRFFFRELDTLFWSIQVSGENLQPLEVGMYICLF